LNIRCYDRKGKAYSIIALGISIVVYMVVSLSNLLFMLLLEKQHY
jgi:hypothetical protein